MIGSTITHFFPELSPKSFTLYNSSIVIISAVVVASISVYLNYVKKRYDLSKHLPSRVRLLGFFGNINDLPKMKKGFRLNAALLQLSGAFVKIFNKQKIFCGWAGFMPLIVVFKADSVEELITNPYTSKKGWFYDFLHPWLGTGLLTSHGKKWKSRRKLLNPSFHFDVLQECLPMFNDHANRLLKTFQNEISNDFTDIVKPLTVCSMSIMRETILGVKNEDPSKETAYVRAAFRQAETIAERILTISQWIATAFKITDRGKQQQKDLKLLHDFTRTIIKDRMKEHVRGDYDGVEKKRKAILDVLLESHIKTRELNEEDVREEVDTFTFEGHDATSMGMSWAFYLIGLYQDVQENLRKEVDRIFGSDTERPVTLNDINDMKYLDCVLKECQRLYPSVPLFAREPTKDIQIAGYNVPKGSLVVVYTYYLHRDPEVFPNPEKFDPDRFLPENCANRHPYAYIPFSAGPRNCIGQRFAILKEKVVIANALRKFAFKSLDHRDKLFPATELILKPPTAVRVQIRPRTHH